MDTITLIKFFWNTTRSVRVLQTLQIKSKRNCCDIYSENIYANFINTKNCKKIRGLEL